MYQSLLPIPFIFIRHGETDWNRTYRTMGQTDIPLNDLGIQQAIEATQYLENLSIERIIHSPLSRAAQTASIINERLKLPIYVQDNLKECGWGVQEGRLKGNAFTTENWVNGFTPEGAEPYIEFRKRTVHAISEAIADKVPTLIVAHGGLFWALMDVLRYSHRRIQNCIPVTLRPPEASDQPWQVLSLDPSYEIMV